MGHKKIWKVFPMTTNQKSAFISWNLMAEPGLECTTPPLPSGPTQHNNCLFNAVTLNGRLIRPVPPMKLM